MNPLEVVLSALEAVVANKLRSLLTALGIIIGIGAVIAMMALGAGAQQSVADRLRGLGTNVLTVRPGQAFQGGVGKGQAPLTVADAQALAKDARGVRAVAPEMESKFQVEVGGKNASLSVVGTWPTYFDVNKYQIAGGRLFTDAEDRGGRRVVVAGALAGASLGVSAKDLMGQTLRIKGVPFEVIGVLAEKGAQGFANPDESFFVPLATAQLRLTGQDRIRSVAVQAASDDEQPLAMAEIDRVLRREHRLHPGAKADFDIRDQASLLSTYQETAQTFSFLLAGIAAISLLVGGIGIMNIMLVSVTERTREIGLRKALGARPVDILQQFLIEALVLCSFGGLVGVLAGLGASAALQQLAGWTMAVSVQSVLLAFGFAAVVGVTFGLWPARRAASLAPIEALRYE
jgi:putative ABC transport system permease protein